MNKPNSSTASTNNNSSRYHHQSNQDIQQNQQYSHQQDNGVNAEIYKTGNNEMVREPLNPVWNIAKPIQNLGKSAASMLMFTPEDRNSNPFPSSTTIIDPCTSSSTNHYSNNNNNNNNTSTNNNISSSRSNMHASPSERTSSSCNNYMHQNMNQSSSYYHVSDTVQSVQDVPPTSNKNNYSYSSKERHTPSAIGSTINSQLLHTNRGVQINNFDIPSSNCHTEQVGKSFIQQHDQLVQTNQELKTNMTTTDIEFANNNYNTNRVSTVSSSAGTINHQPQESNIDHANNTSNEFHNSSNSTNNNRRRTFNYNSTTLDHNMFNNNSPPPPPPLPSSSMNHQYYSSQYYPPQQQHPSPNHSVIPPPMLNNNNNNSKRISPSTVHYSSNTNNNNESRFYDEKSRITTPSSQQHPQQHVESHVPYYKNSIHVSPTSTTYQYSSHHQQQQHVQTPGNVVPSPRKVSRERPPYPDQVMSHNTPSQQQPYYQPSQQERSLDTPYSSNSGYQQITNNQTRSNLSAQNFNSTDSSFNGRNASHSGSSDDNSDSKLIQGGASDSSRKHKKKGPKKREISRDDMKKYFNVSQTVAARMLGVSVSTLKRRFYEEFNMKWPYVPSKTNTSKRKKEDGEAITGNDSQQNSDEQTSSHEMIQPPQFDSPYKKVKRDVVFENANQSHADSYQNYNNNYAPPYSQNERSTANSSHNNGSVHTYSSIINKNIDNNASSGAVHHVRSENVSYVAPTRNNHVISYQHAEPYSPPSATTIRNNTGNNTLHSYHVPSPQVNHQNIRNANSPPGYMMRSEDVYSSSNNMIPTQPHQFTESTTASEPNMLPPISSFKMESWK